MDTSKTRDGTRVADGYNAPMQTEQWQQSKVSWQVIGGRLLAAAAKPRTAKVINGVAVIGLAAVLAHWTWGALSSPTRFASPPVTQARSVPPPLRVLLKSHLFGQSPTTALASIPVSHLALTLSGLVAGHPGVALIAGAGGKVHPYLVGMSVSPGVVLAAVTANRAIVRQDGRLESLLLYSRKSAVAPGSASPSMPIAPAAAGVQPHRPGLAPAVTVRVKPSVVSAFASVSNATLKSWLVPGPDGGVLVKGAPAPAFASLGLHQGDVIEEVNGQPVNSLGAAVSAYIAGAKSGDVTVDVARDGHMKVFQYTMQAP